MALVSYGAQDIYMMDTNTNGEQLYDNTNNQIQIHYKDFEVVNLLINKEYEECPLTMQHIEQNEKYYHCIHCNNNMKETFMNEYNNFNKCPICRQSEWTNNKIYVNSL